MYNKKVVLVLGVALVCLGLFGSKFDLGSKTPVNNSVSVSVDKPSDEALLTLAQDLVSCVKNSKVTREDGLKLANLAMDMSTLIGLDGSSEVIKSTEEIRQANRLSGMMLRMDMNKKYPELASKMNTIVIAYIGDDIVSLNAELRTKSCDVFKAIAWAFVEGTK